MIPIPLAWLLHLGLGLGFALAARGRLRADGTYATPAFTIALAHVGLVIAPLATYFHLVQADWTWMYWLDPAKVPTLAIVPLVAIHVGLVLAGWLLGAWIVRLDQVRLGRWLLVGLSVATVLGLLLSLPRVLTASTYADYRHGRSGGLMRVELGWAVLVSLLATAVSAAYTVVELLRDSRRARVR